MGCYQQTQAARGNQCILNRASSVRCILSIPSERLDDPHIARDAFYFHERCFIDACTGALAVIEGGALRCPVSPADLSTYIGVDKLGRLTAH